MSSRSTQVWQAGPAMSSRPGFLTALRARRTWRELSYALLGIWLGIVGFVFVVTTLTLSAGLAVTFVGLPLLAFSGGGARFLAGGARQQANTLLGADVRTPPPPRSRPGTFGYLRGRIADAAAWRARLYLVLKLPSGILCFVVAVTWYMYGFGGVTYPIWRPFLPCNEPTGTCHGGANFGNEYTMDTPWRIAAVAAGGLVFLILAPWVVHAVVTLDKWMVQGLLGPTANAERLAELQRTRAAVVEDAAATLRRIERDLHDGTQAQLVSVAMNVGLAREKLAEGGDPVQVLPLLDAAHTTAKQAIVELRDLAKGIHPPVLDTGLATAITTLAARSPVPVHLDLALPEQAAARASASIEAIGYFCVAELLTNVAKHSHADQAWVLARIDRGRLILEVADDGVGNARLGAGSGLRGLAERIASVDGTLSVVSPEGGPTRITVELPMTTATNGDSR